MKKFLKLRYFLNEVWLISVGISFKADYLIKYGIQVQREIHSQKQLGSTTWILIYNFEWNFSVYEFTEIPSKRILKYESWLHRNIYKDVVDANIVFLHILNSLIFQ